MQVNNLRYSLLDKLISDQDMNLLEKVNELIGNVDVNKSVFKIAIAALLYNFSFRETIILSNPGVFPSCSNLKTCVSISFHLLPLMRSGF